MRTCSNTPSTQTPCYSPTKATDKFITNIPKMPDLGYKQMPTVYQLAALMHNYSTSENVEMSGYNISPETLELAKQFYDLMNQNPGNEQLQLKTINEKFGDTYLYYFIRKFQWMPNFTGWELIVGPLFAEQGFT